jgi:NTE family protein
VVKIGLRTLDLLMNELFICDLREFLHINALVQEAAGHGITLHHPDSGRPLKFFECKIIEPDFPLGDTLDFSRPAVERSLQAGFEQARKVLG